MPDNSTFLHQRDAAFDAIITWVESQARGASPTLLLDHDALGEEALRQNAQKESWSLFLNGLRHLKCGAPDGQPGSMPEALSRSSLRAGGFAAALGVRPPQFEQIYFSVDYTTGGDAALFVCRRLVEGAQTDLPKSKQVIHQKMLKSAGDDVLKKQMALTFNILGDTYAQSCLQLKEEISRR